MLEDQGGGWWSGKEKESGRSEIIQDIGTGSWEEVCIEPCNALIKTLGFTLSEMRMYQKVLNWVIIWSN